MSTTHSWPYKKGDKSCGYRRIGLKIEVIKEDPLAL